MKMLSSYSQKTHQAFTNNTNIFLLLRKIIGIWGQNSKKRTNDLLENKSDLILKQLEHKDITTLWGVKDGALHRP
jgi:hypothetical protein